MAYEYDKQYQLTKETRYAYSGTSTTPSTTVNTFTYDTAGNLLSENRNGTTKTYTYGNANWGDLLTKYDGVTINYDGSGNPTSWYNGTSYSNLTWTMGRQLASITKGDKTYSYDYDMAGIRSSKTVDGVVHNYITQNGRVVQETYGSTVLIFTYDASGLPFSVDYSTNGGSSFTTYYYVTNMQGDVMELLYITADSSGVFEFDTEAVYTYDAWGKVLSVTNRYGTAITSSTHIGNVNPLRYRGYYYDTETSFYYLQSRYYDPVVKRFINADALTNAQRGPTGYNMFAYCGNNPVRRIDVSGFSWFDDAWDWVTGAAEDVWDWTCETAEEAWEWTCDAAEETWEWACETAEAVYDYVTNTDEEVVLEADFLAFYNGVPVIRLPIGWNAASFGIIFLGDQYTNDQYGRNTLNHEYGHSLQMAEYGPILYTFTVAVPSLAGNALSRLDLLPCNYYSLPWEHEADILGDVTRSNYDTWAGPATKVYAAINDVVRVITLIWGW